MIILEWTKHSHENKNQLKRISLITVRITLESLSTVYAFFNTSFGAEILIHLLWTIHIATLNRGTLPRKLLSMPKQWIKTWKSECKIFFPPGPDHLIASFIITNAIAVAWSIPGYTVNVYTSFPIEIPGVAFPSFLSTCKSRNWGSYSRNCKISLQIEIHPII